jgi:hypothetical protein
MVSSLDKYPALEDADVKALASASIADLRLHERTKQQVKVK